MNREKDSQPRMRTQTDSHGTRNEEKRARLLHFRLWYLQSRIGDIWDAYNPEQEGKREEREKET